MFKFPDHIGVIPDGNRRWAQARGKNKQDGYARGLDAGLALLRAAQARGIKEITFYGFTTDNCKRPRAQVEAFSAACVKAAELIEKEGARLTVVGNADSPRFPKELKKFTKRRECENGAVRVNLLVNYGWEWDLKNGFASGQIPRIDLVARWGGMCRLSGFLPVQTVYADICVLDELWPDFKKEQLDRALDWYRRQDVTLGG